MDEAKGEVDRIVVGRALVHVHLTDQGHVKQVIVWDGHVNWKGVHLYDDAHNRNDAGPKIGGAKEAERLLDRAADTNIVGDAAFWPGWEFMG